MAQEDSPGIAFLEIRRKRGIVSVMSTDIGWSIVGRGEKSTMRMRIPRCPCLKPVCETLHDENTGHSSTRTPTILSCGYKEQHGKNHCHAGHVSRVKKIIDLVAKTYGPAVKG